MCAALERPDLADDARFRTNSDRVTNREALVAELERVFAARPAAEWIARLAGAGVPAGKVRGVLEALAEAERAGRAATAEVEHPTAGTLPLVATPLRPGAGTRPAGPPPLLGQHTREVLAELGCSAEELDALERAGVVA
jgi:crotonobetainyl-CoA:carnitine CoA-transferase CaiB-like acyl-CoA transferase